MKAFAGLGVAMAIISTTTYAEAEEWPSSGYFDVVELDDSCAAFGEFQFDGRPDIRFMLSYDGDEVLISFSSHGWSSTDGQSYDISFFFRDITGYTGEARGYTTGLIYHGFAAKFGPEVLDSFAQAASLQVVKDGTTVTHINLRGSSAATSTLKRCAASVRQKNAAVERRERRWDYIERDPFAPAPTTPGQPN